MAPRATDLRNELSRLTHDRFVHDYRFTLQEALFVAQELQLPRVTSENGNGCTAHHFVAYEIQLAGAVHKHRRQIREGRFLGVRMFACCRITSIFSMVPCSFELS